MAEKKAVLFNLWGVAVSSTPHAVFQKAEALHKLPGGFLSSLVSKQDSAMIRAETGQISLSQMVPELEAECVKEAQVRSLTLLSDWSVRGLLEKLKDAMVDVQPAVLKTAAELRRNDADAGPDGDGWKRPGPAAGPLQGDGGLDPQPEQRTHRGLCTLDSDGQSIRDKPDPHNVARKSPQEGRDPETVKTLFSARLSRQKHFTFLHFHLFSLMTLMQILSLVALKITKETLFVVSERQNTNNNNIIGHFMNIR